MTDGEQFYGGEERVERGGCVVNSSADKGRRARRIEVCCMLVKLLLSILYVRIFWAIGDFDTRTLVW